MPVNSTVLRNGNNFKLLGKRKLRSYQLCKPFQKLSAGKSYFDARASALMLAKDWVKWWSGMWEGQESSNEERVLKRLGSVCGSGHRVGDSAVKFVNLGARRHSVWNNFQLAPHSFRVNSSPPPPLLEMAAIQKKGFPCKHTTLHRRRHNVVTT